MPLKIYNTLTGKKEIFRPIKKNHVGIYSCGPTVYWYQHVGNLRSYVSWDVLKRVLKFNGFRVRHVINVTDVGHLTDDADDGDDKIEKAARKEGKTAEEISEYYFRVFRNELKKLNVIEPDFWPRATKHIKEQIEIIKELEKKGFTYETSDGIYFDTGRLKDYGKLARLKKENLKAGKRVEIGEKKNKTDFALWKFSEKKTKRQQEWKSPWGIGFPGWHVECSAMSSKYLGKQFDVHTGGQEHIPVHHTNEIAQSESCFGKKPWVKYWMHAAWLLYKGEKISKSKGGLYTLSELEKKKREPLELRYLFLTTHYKKPLDFSLEKLDAAKNSLQRLKNLISELREKNTEKENEKYLREFTRAINEDLNVPEALRSLWNLLKDKKAKGKLKTAEKMDEVLGLNLLKKEKLKIPDAVKKLVDEREKARRKKEWKTADELRRKINKAGYVLEDNKKGVMIKKSKNGCSI